MSAVQPDCYGHCGRKAAVGRMFCSTRCAAEYAEGLMRGNEEQWCVPCADWKGVAYGAKELDCGHIAAGLVEGMHHNAAAKKYSEKVREWYALHKHKIPDSIPGQPEPTPEKI